MSTEISDVARVNALRTWYRRPLGRLLAETELNALMAQLSNLFGYHLMVVDPPWEDCPLKDNRIPHQFIQSVAPVAQSATGLAGHTDDWPIMTDSIDAIILPHTLELSRDPHQVLREADRSLIPDGHLVILGFNPHGPWGMWRLFTPWRRHMPWNSRFLGLSRIKDWLGLLGFDTLESHYLFHRPPVQNTRLLEKLRLLEPVSGHGRKLLSAAYILVARKRTTIITPLKAERARRRRLFPVGIPSSSQGNVRRARHN
ncbi:MAG: methyltransferase domain-containing protein [Gammaproteobacteria bacterium]|nr:methyltransferase domain-containing protein [Gammaproteobacteria bacterium]